MYLGEDREVPIIEKFHKFRILHSYGRLKLFADKLKNIVQGRIPLIGHDQVKKKENNILIKENARKGEIIEKEATKSPND